MEIKKITIKELIRNYSQINIPFYQREYVWTQKETRKFLEDIVSNTSSEYYIGSIVIKSDYSQYKIIDGQQRISTIWMIIKALEMNSNFLEPSYVISLKESLDNFKIDPRNLNKGEILKKIIQYDDQNLSDEEKESNYALNFLAIKNYFDSYCGKLDEFVKNFNGVVATLVVVEKEVDEQILFSQINSTGKKLSAFDLVRNKLFSSIQEEIKKETDDSKAFDEKIKNKIEIFDKTFNFGTSNKEGENDEIIRHFISYKNKNLCKNDSEKIYEEFEKLFCSSYYSNNGLVMFEQICNFALVYNFLKLGFSQLNYKFNNSLELLTNSFKTYAVLLVDIFMKNSTINNFKIEKLSEKQESIINECFKVLENYKIRREFCPFDEKTITRFIPTVSKLVENLIKKFPNLNYYECLYYILFMHSNNVKNYPPNELPTYRAPLKNEFQNKFINCPIYEHRKFCKNFLIRIGESKTKINFNNFSIEHILPQDLSKWRNNGYLELESETSNFIDTIGNLTLTPYNSEYSNEIFLIKVKLMKENESFVLNNYFFNLNKWDISEIKQRANVLFEKVNSIWNFENYDSKLSKIENQLDEIYSNLEQVKVNDYPYENKKEIIKNISHFSKIGKITKDQIFQLIKNYCQDGISLEENEYRIFKMKFRGFVNMSINRFLSIGESSKKSLLTDEDFNKYIKSKSKDIDVMLDFIESAI